jgi:hypothetical protein
MWNKTLRRGKMLIDFQAFDQDIGLKNIKICTLTTLYPWIILGCQSGELALYQPTVVGLLPFRYLESS